MQHRIQPAILAGLMAAMAPAVVSLAAIDGPLGDVAPGDKPEPARDEAVTRFLTAAQSDAISRFRAEHPLTGMLHDETDLVDRIYGAPFAGGDTPDEAAVAAIDAVAGILGAPAEHFVSDQPIGMMHDPATGEPKFLLYRFNQQLDDVEVFRSRVSVLVRTLPGFPVSWIGSDAKPLGDFRPAPGLRDADVPADVRQAIEADAAPGTTTRYSEVRGVIFAGHENRAMSPVNAITFVAETGTLADPDTYAKVRYLVHADTGAVIHEESLVHRMDLSGNVGGRATTGIASMDCEPEELFGMPYAEVLVNGIPTHADVDGDWAMAAPADGPFTVESGLSGLYFHVNNMAGPNASIIADAVPGDDVQIIHNDANDNEFTRAEVNAYLEANRIRDWALQMHSEYPVIQDELGFEINVNLTGGCNAWYTGDSIELWASDGACGNTAFTSVVHHEYGHHMINVGGSGQGAYGEGMADTVSVLLMDDPRVGMGYLGDCDSPVRNADNDCQYLPVGCSTCGDQIHDCGQLLSGAIWDTRQILETVLGDDALTYVSQLTVNSILLHTGTSIDPSIAIDFLTLDDDDAGIGNGTPNHLEIIAAFAAHDLATTYIDPVWFSLPLGIPYPVSSSCGETITLEIEPIGDSPIPGTGVMKVLNDGQTLTVPLVPSGVPNQYLATFPETQCGSVVEFHFEVQTEGGLLLQYPAAAPDSLFSTFSAESLEFGWADDFETDQGWTVVNQGNNLSGAWERGIPNTDGPIHGKPLTDADGSGQCFVTGNGPGVDDVDYGFTYLISPLMDPTVSGTTIFYHRWFSNSAPSNPEPNDEFRVHVSDDGGATWVVLEIVGPTGPEVLGGWIEKQFDLTALPDFELNDAFRIRFTALDLHPWSTVEAGVDGVRLGTIECPPPQFFADLDGDCDVDVADLLIFLASWGFCPDGEDCPADFNGDGTVSIPDLLMFLTAFGS